MGEWRLGTCLDGCGTVGYTRDVKRIPVGILAALVTSGGPFGCSVDQSALAPGSDAVAPLEVDSGGPGLDGAPDSGRDSGSDAGEDGGFDSALPLDSSVPPDTSPPDAGCVVTGSGVDLCNGIDDDCNPLTDDGSADPGLLVRCDGPDGDSCREGMRRCVGGELVCDDTTETDEETCNSADDDCDGAIDEGVQTLYYSDADGDGYGLAGSGVLACAAAGDRSAIAGDCDDGEGSRNPGAAEACTMEDTNCNGAIDEGCPCSSALYGGRLYSFCSGGRTYDESRDLCVARGQDLALIEDSAENEFVVGEVYSRGLNVAYVGLQDRSREMEWRGAGGETLSFFAWSAGEPNDDCGFGCSEDCGVVGWDGHPAATSWNDANCRSNFATVCEGAVP